TLSLHDALPISSWLIAAISFPSNRIWPSVGLCSPAAIVRIVLFPDPDVPTKAVIFPFSREKLIPFNTSSCTSQFVNVFLTSSIVKTVILYLSFLDRLQWFEFFNLDPG